MGNARILGLDDFVGSIERGKSADLIVVRDNTLDDFAALRNVQMVMMRGKLIRDPRVKRMREINQLLDRYMHGFVNWGMAILTHGPRVKRGLAQRH